MNSLFSMNFLAGEAADTSSAAQQPGAMASLLPLLMLVGMFVLMYFIMIRPNKKRQKAEEKMRNSLQIGDEIVTISGVFCTIVAIKDDSIIVASGPDRTKMRIARWAVQQNLTVHD